MAVLTATHEWSEQRRLAACSAIGVVIGLPIAVLAPWQLGLLGGWDVASLCLVGLIRHQVWGLDAAETAAVARRDDDSRAMARAVLVSTGLVSLIGVVAGLARARSLEGFERVALTSVAMLAVACSWLVVHVTFVLRYAHRYYVEAHGSIDFPGDDEPSYVDFAYFGFTVGMTFQVSDTNVTERGMRALVLRHACLSYVFGAVIIALAINVLAQLVS